MKNVKYYAGLFDADGSFDMWPTKREDGSYYINIKATLYQNDLSVIQPIADFYGAPICKDNRNAGNYSVTLHGTKAEMFMNELKNHLVIKRAVVEFLLSIKGTKTDDIKSVRQQIKDKRAERSPEKNFPSRRWMAGYVDGDGCIHSSFRKSDGNLEFKLTVVSHSSQMAGLELLQKAFGGYIVSQADVRRWNISLSVTKGKQLLTFFGQHLVMKKEQADLVLSCLESGVTLRRRGATYEGNLRIHQQLQELKLPASTKRFNPEMGCYSQEH